MGKKAMQMLSLKDEEFYEGMGIAFVKLTTTLGYGKTVAHLVIFFRQASILALMSAWGFNTKIQLSLPKS
jgi:hypothetical protein